MADVRMRYFKLWATNLMVLNQYFVHKITTRCTVVLTSKPRLFSDVMALNYLMDSDTLRGSFSPSATAMVFLLSARVSPGRPGQSQYFFLVKKL